MRTLGTLTKTMRRVLGRRSVPAEALEQVEQRLQTVVEGAHGVIYIAELATDGRWIYVSPQIERILGFTPAEWMADPELWSRQIHPDDREAVLAEERELTTLTPGRMHASEYRLVTRSGETRWVRDSATIVASADDTLVWSGVLTDVTEQRLTREELQASEERFRTVIETASDAFVGMDAQGVIVEWNRKAEELFGWRREEALGRPLAETIVPERYRQAHARGVEKFLRTGYGPVLDRTLELSALRRDGREFPVELTVWSSPVGGVQRLSAFVRDVTERKALEAVTHRAFHDPLTDLPNRLLFTDRVEHALSRLSRPTFGSIAVLVLDLDDFKTVNDSLGHVAGDRLLIEVAARLRSCLRPADTLARLSGDEFAILLEDLASISGATTVAERINRVFDEPIELDSVEVFTRTSIGIAFGRGTPSPEELIADADAALYAAKSHGKGRYEVFEPSMREAVASRRQLKEDLRRALERGELRVLYQPYVRLADSTIEGAEALIRWHHRERGVVEPLEFVPLAEEMGLIVPIGRWVLRHACEQAAEWRKKWPDEAPLTLRVNVSSRQLQDRLFVQDVAAILADTGFPPKHLVLEITERSLVEDHERIVARLAELKGLGIRIALDGFGTALSSLSSIQRLPIDILKVDRSFVSGLGRSGPEAAMARAIVQLAHILDLEAIAQGVERAEQIPPLRELACEFAQGYHFSPPVPAVELEAQLQHERAERGRKRGPRLAAS
jgi:diguanylate cyclase (GGDEF)-like protein/PAS domain S-box-containing protein